MMSRDMKKMW